MAPLKNMTDLHCLYASCFLGIDDVVSCKTTFGPKSIWILNCCYGIQVKNSQFQIKYCPIFKLFCLLFTEEVHANNIIHADIKPANFVLVKGQLKIIDFGFAMKIGKKYSFKKSSNSFHWIVAVLKLTASQYSD